VPDNFLGLCLELPKNRHSSTVSEAERDEVLQKLLQGDITGYKSQSSADFVLIMKLLHWTGDNIQLTRQLFKESGLYREKTERKPGAPILIWPLRMSSKNAETRRWDAKLLTFTLNLL